MRAAFVKNLLWLQLLNWLVKPLWILWIEREIQLRMGDSWYGVYTLHFNLVLLFAVLLDAFIALETIPTVVLGLSNTPSLGSTSFHQE